MNGNQAELDCGLCRLRAWRTSDKASLLVHANNFDWRNVRDRFPHPYTEADADTFLEQRMNPTAREFVYAIDVDGEAVGGLGLHPRTDVERCSAEIGYWLGAAFQGRGLATAAVRAASRYALEQPDLFRVFAHVFAWNAASMRVLEKAGFTREGVMARSAIKNGIVIDQVMYGLTRDP